MLFCCRSPPQGRSQSSLLREEDAEETEDVLRVHGSEPDLREVGGPGRERRKIVRGRVSPGSRKLRAQPPPELTLPPPPWEPPPPLPASDHPPAGTSSSRRRLFRPHVQRRPAGSRPPPAIRAVSEERSAAVEDGDSGGGRTRARSVDCLQAVLRQREDSLEKEEEKRENASSLPRKNIKREVPQERSRSVLQHSSELDEFQARSRSEGALQASFEWPQMEEATQKSWRHKEEIAPEVSGESKQDSWDDHRIKIEVATNDIQVGGGEENKPKLVFFGMENGPPAPTDRIVPEEGRISALTKVKHNEEVSITGARVSYRRPAEHRSGSASRGSAGSGESEAARATNLHRIPTQKLNDFMSTIERSKRRQLSASRDELLTNSPARSYRSQSSVFDCELQVGTESISMHLRPSLPKKQQQIPRFSPLAAWKSLHLDEAARREWREEPLTKQPLRDQLCRHRPIAQSADSGIGGDAGSPPPPSPQTSATTGADTTSAELPLAASSPPPATRPGCWTPAQDLEEASSGDDTSLGAAEGSRRTLPKLTSRGGMFIGSERPTTTDGRNTVGVASGAGVNDRSSKNSAEQPAQSPNVSLDQNWLLSRSVPSSLNADGDLADIPSRSDASRHVMYLPEYHSMRVERGRSVSPHGRDMSAASMWHARGTSPDCASPEKPPRTSASTGGRRKFAFQSTLRLIEKKKLETQLSRDAEEKERQRRDEQEAMQRVEREFLQKRLGESQSVLHRHRLNVSRLELTGDEVEDTPRPAEPCTSSNVTSSDTGSDRGFSSHKESPQSSPRSVSDIPLPQFKLPAPANVSRGDDYWEASKPPECPPPDYNSLPPLLDQHPISLPPPEQPLPPPADRTVKAPVAPAAAAAAKSDRPRLLSGVRNWLRGRRDGGRHSAGNMAKVYREEPEGQAASSPDRQVGPAGDSAETRWRRGFDPQQRQHRSAERLVGTASMFL